jgi:hypothetical protein
MLDAQAIGKGVKDGSTKIASALASSFKKMVSAGMKAASKATTTPRGSSKDGSATSAESDSTKDAQSVRQFSDRLK